MFTASARSVEAKFATDSCLVIITSTTATDKAPIRKNDCVSSCGIPLMPGMYQVVGLGRGDGRRSGSHGWSV